MARCVASSCGPRSAGFAVEIHRVHARSSVSDCPGIARVYGRQTERASEIVRLIGYVAGGLSGPATSGSIVHRRPVMTLFCAAFGKSDQKHPPVPIHNLGVDDWAWRKGQEYGTILVNLDLHRVVDLLPDRAAESFSAWLQAASGNRDHRAGSLRPLCRRRGARGTAIAADRRSLPPHLEPLGDDGAGAGRAKQATDLASSRRRCGTNRNLPRTSEDECECCRRRCPDRHSRNCAGNVDWSATSKSSLCSIPAIRRRRSAAPLGIQRKTIRRWLRRGRVSRTKAAAPAASESE